MRNAETILGIIRDRGSRGLPLERYTEVLTLTALSPCLMVPGCPQEADSRDGGTSRAHLAA